MAPIPLFVFFFLTSSLLPSSAEKKEYHYKCPPFSCGGLGPIHFPFNNKTNPECGVFTVDCSQEKSKIQLKEGGHWYAIENISQADSIVVKETTLLSKSDFTNDCHIINNFSIPSSKSSLFFFYNLTAKKTSTLYNCSDSLGNAPSKDFHQTNCRDSDFYSNPRNISFPLEQQCPIVTLPFPFPLPHHEHHQLSIDFIFQVQISPYCWACHLNGGKCHNENENRLQCLNPLLPLPKEQKKTNLKFGLGLGLGLGFGVLLAMSGLAIIIWRRKHVASGNVANPYMNMEYPEWASGYLGVPVFSYKELTEATNNFDADKNLGHGGFGTVYHGKLKDGREVAVKRLYEHNYKRVEQFTNEIEILTLLRHKNLVVLYGCTSPRCTELLLAYEYIPNGTVADHLHGDCAKTSPLTWQFRLSIAIETASALAYLHASDIVHRDVKTNNILLDNNLCVKVADFGLSRLFPNDATHVSTAPQGTLGYVDPEYHQCYQLTSKSDVYSFGVVLVELLSSLPAVDITRDRHEINLSNLAICKIQKRAYNELIDQCLGFASDTKVRIMTIAVAELAFECLQQDKEMRPTMDEVLERLRRIEDEKFEIQVVDGSMLNMSSNVQPPSPPSPDCDEVGLFKKIKQEQPPSPNDVTQNWPSIASSKSYFSC
ncbi:LEAF RUST 10 DISEASE-RESISTANCE LOCUS RECEPTOR-LIKE PROTEIN KINASE-like 1.1 [Humulus lupulus]|uniref:LEAF RUST 10 DISEASE-RESISTANCE LOCUS RECEPTOR-LIKE PROTEIN KINASE-like 1.1 n=1 Tax=Humulus lupulus TaxID=3486 RepID=UPI002B410D6E|nr:LEAF RUST 10 DISEASE-RESISTANCE LOCUS RECEPTOR-LIKE PROTEIN KINASE-like 1.1 [Humulus lupulus]